jgi:AcrR family transcriptional regulator
MRKAPRQQRSRVTVDAIVEAATRVLARRGWARFTTNEIAAVAGVSVGSLYQYFPDKLAIAEAIRQRHLDEVLAALGRCDEEGDPAATFPRRVERFVDGVIAAHSVDQALHRVLVDEVPLAARSSYPSSRWNTSGVTAPWSRKAESRQKEKAPTPTSPPACSRRRSRGPSTRRRVAATWMLPRCGPSSSGWSWPT